MKSIGFRAEKDRVLYVVLDVDGDQRTIVDEGKLVLGERKDICGELVFLRTELLNLLKAAKADVGGIRLPDNPQKLRYAQSMFTRCRLEGVVMLAAGEFGLPLTAGAAATIKAGIKTKTRLSTYTGSDDFHGIDLSVRGRQSAEYFDAVSAALAALGQE